MIYYIGKKSDSKIERSTNSFLFATPTSKIGQLVRSTMFSFIAEDNEIVKLVLYKTSDKKKYTQHEFDFMANTSLQKINETMNITFQKCDTNYYCCPTLIELK
jgi:hypothetical protein